MQGSELINTEQITSLMQKTSIPGISIAVISDDHIETSTLGVANAASEEILTDEVVFEACSLSKPVFAYLVMQLVKEEIIELDEPLGAILPPDELAKVLSDQSLSKIQGIETLTPRMILSHQTGLPNLGITSENELEKGKFRYSGAGYHLLQAVLEKKEGKSLNKLAKQYVFEPLKMTHSSFGWDEKQATGHDELNHPTPREISHEENAAASLSTTASDYALFLKAALSDPIFFNLHVDVPNSQLAWGLGFGLQKDSKVFHWGDNGIFKAFVAINLKEKTAIVYFANSVNGLAIAQDVVTPIMGKMQPTFDWLLTQSYEYEQHDSPSWQNMFNGRKAEAVGNYEEAKSYYSKPPENPTIQRRIKFLDDLMTADTLVHEEILKKYVGQYDGPKVTLEPDGYLHLTYGKTFRLIPLSETRFAAEHDSSKQFEFTSDDDGNGTQVIAHFTNGSTMASSRKAEELSDNPVLTAPRADRM